MSVSLERELEKAVEEVAPTLIDAAELQRLVEGDEESSLDEECTLHDSCRPV